MMRRMLKTYTISVTIQEGSDEFWDSLAGKSGCDEVVELVKDVFGDSGLINGVSVRLERFEEREPM